jgi:hypothetical protein
MTERLLRSMFVAWVVTVLVACSAPGAAPNAIRVSIQPQAVVLATGGTQIFAATVDGTTDAGVSWTATGGTLTPNAGGALYTAPDVPGTYLVVVTSAADPARSATAMVTVDSPAPTTRVEIRSEPSVLLTQAGEQHLALAVVVDDDGSEVPGATIDWSSTDASVATVDAAGVITAVANVGTATIRASAEGATAASIEVAVARLAANARVVSAESVLDVGSDARSATFTRSTATEDIVAGTVIASSAGILARVTAVAMDDDTVQVLLEDVPISEAFPDVQISGLSEPISFTTVIDDDAVTVLSTDPRIGVQAFGIDKLECKTSLGSPVAVKLVGARIVTSREMRVGVDYASDTKVMDFYVEETASFTASLGPV